MKTLIQKSPLTIQGIVFMSSFSFWSSKSLQYDIPFISSIPDPNPLDTTNPDLENHSTPNHESKVSIDPNDDPFLTKTKVHTTKCSSTSELTNIQSLCDHSDYQVSGDIIVGFHTHH